MFNLERAIEAWRKDMQAAGVKAPVPLDELETHLRDELAGCRVDQQTFDAVVAQFGNAHLLRSEFKKNSRRNMKRKIIIALAVFAFLLGASIIMPALAQHNHRDAGRWATDEVVPILTGCVIALAGIGAVGYSLKSRRNAPVA
ncbi:MAG: hypothetical protein ACXWIU_00885 [Limisphaerales bacterium]